MFQFSTWPEHEEHVKKCHEGIFVSRCKYCPKFFQHALLARKHMREVHPKKDGQSNIPEEMCVECGKIVSKTNMKEHMDRDHGGVEYKCDKCPKICKSKWQLWHHTKCHEECIPCQFCGENIRPIKMKKHILAKHTPDDLKPFRCTTCTKGFANEKYLKLHMNTHTGAKPYKCVICNAAFAHPANHRAHMRAHEGIKRKK